MTLHPDLPDPRAAMIAIGRSASKHPIVVSNVWKQYQLGTSGPLARMMRRLSPSTARKLGMAEDFWALQDVSLRVEPGEALGVIGKNGAGKSTLLKVLCGVTPPSRGSVTLQGRVAPLIEVGAGFHPELTGRENVYLNASIMGMSRGEIAAKFDAIVDFAALDKFIDTPVKKYSSGMLVRLGFSVAVHVEPDVMLVDEVLSVGDLSFILKSYRKITEIKKQGAPIILVSHNLQQVRNFCDRALWLDGGCVKMLGTPAEVAAAYTRATFAAGDVTDALDNAAEIYRVHADKSLTITSVETLNSSGAATSMFATGEQLSVRIRYHAARATGPLIFSIAVFQEETGALLVVHNNSDDGVVFPGSSGAGEGCVVLDFHRQPFIAGLHRMTVILCEGNLSVVADWHEKMYSFKVAGGPVGYGAFHAFPAWRAGETDSAKGA